MPETNATTAAALHRLADAIVLLALLLVLVAPKAAHADQSQCIGAAEARRLHAWAKVLAAEGGETFGDVDLSARRGAAILVFHTDGGPLHCEVTPYTKSAETIACESQPAKAADELSVLFGQHALPTDLWRACEARVLGKTPPIEPEAWRWWAWAFVFVPLVLFIFWARRFFKRLSPIEKSQTLRLALLCGVTLMVGLHAIALGDVQVYDGDAERDHLTAILLARGVEAPLYGPAVNAGWIRLGPLYQTIMGAGMWVWESHLTPMLISSLAVMLSLLVGAAFLRRAFGVAAASAFALLWPGSFLPLINLTRISHNYWALPLAALSLWLSWHVLKTRHTRELPLLALSVGLAAQLYAVFAIYGVAVLALLLVFRIMPRLRDIVLASLALLISQAHTLAFAVQSLLVEKQTRAFAVGYETFAQLGFTLKSIWHAFSGIHPFEGRMFGYVVGLMLIMFLWRSIKPPEGEGREARMVLLVNVAFPISVALATYASYRSTFSACFILPAVMIVAVGISDWMKEIPTRHARRLARPLVALAALIMALLIACTDPLMPNAGYRQKGVHAPDQIAMAQALRRVGVVDIPNYRGRVHGKWAHAWVQTMRLHAWLMLLNNPPEQPLGDDEIWLSDNQHAAIRPKAWVLPVSTRYLAARVIRYNSRLDYAGARLLVGTKANIQDAGQALPLPMRPFERTRSVRMFYEMSDSVRMIPIIREKRMGTRLRLDLPTRQPLNGPLVLIADKRCELRLFVDEQPVILSGDDDPTTPARRYVASFGQGSRVSLEIDTADCTLSHLDVFDPPIIGDGSELAGGKP